MRIGAHKGIKRVHIARQLGCTLQTVTDMLYGRRLIKPYEIPVIALALGVTIDELFAAGQEQEQKRD